LPARGELGDTGEGAAQLGAQQAMAVNQVVLAQVHYLRPEVLHVPAAKTAGRR
jgi:hypothetical protein